MDYETTRALDEVRGELERVKRALKYDIEKVQQDVNSLRNRVQDMRESLRAEL